MGKPRTPPPVKLICGLLSGDPDLLARSRQLLVKRFGPVDAESPIWDISRGHEYETEMGPNLQRRFLSFQIPIAPGALAEIKLATNKIEAVIAEDCMAIDIARPVNLDPGYVDVAKLVLATTRDRPQCVYLSQGIFAEVTLTFVNSQWQPVPWTHADYLKHQYHEYFSRVRALLLRSPGTVPARRDCRPPSDPPCEAAE